MEFERITAEELSALGARDYKSGNYQAAIDTFRKSLALKKT